MDSLHISQTAPDAHPLFSSPCCFHFASFIRLQRKLGLLLSSTLIVEGEEAFQEFLAGVGGDGVADAVILNS